jgi:hypothetical protein
MPVGIANMAASVVAISAILSEVQTIKYTSGLNANKSCIAPNIASEK